MAIWSAPDELGFGATWWRVARLKVAVFAVLVAWVVGSSVGSALIGHQISPSLDVAQQPAAGPAAILVQEHDCWTGAAPAGVMIPRHAVLSRGTAAPTYAGPRLTHQALDQVFTGKRHGLTVYAFCR